MLVLVFKSMEKEMSDKASIFPSKKNTIAVAKALAGMNSTILQLNALLISITTNVRFMHPYLCFWKTSEIKNQWRLWGPYFKATHSSFKHGKSSQTKKKRNAIQEYLFSIHQKHFPIYFLIHQTALAPFESLYLSFSSGCIKFRLIPQAYTDQHTLRAEMHEEYLRLWSQKHLD